jgi:hypothetical protein
MVDDHTLEKEYRPESRFEFTTSVVIVNPTTKCDHGHDGPRGFMEQNWKNTVTKLLNVTLSHHDIYMASLRWI